jgi:hypothetical protein
MEALGPKRFRSGPHLFLSSSEGGDASVLRGLRVSDDSMLAVDIDKEAVENFSVKFPTITILHTDVSKVLDDIHIPFESIYLDFSNQVSDYTLNRIGAAAKAVAPGGIVACNFSIGREKKFTGFSRIEAVESFLEKKLGYKPEFLARMRYSSSSIYGPGSHMCAIAFRTSPGGGFIVPLRDIKIYDLYRDVERLRNNPRLHLLLNCSRTKAESLRSRVMAYPPPRA